MNDRHEICMRPGGLRSGALKRTGDGSSVHALGLKQFQVAVWVLVLLLSADGAWAQLGSYLGSPTSFNTPSTSFHVGGRYTGDPGAFMAPKPEAYSGGPLSISLVPGMNSRVPASSEGATSYGGGSSLLANPGPSLRQTAMPSAVPSAQPFGEPWGSPMPQAALPEYQMPYSPPKLGLFRQNVTLDSMRNLQYQGAIPLQRIQAKGPSASMVNTRSMSAPASTASPASVAGSPAQGMADASPSKPSANPSSQADATKDLSEIKTAQLSQEAIDCLSHAMEAVKNANYRGMWDGKRYQPGAIALFRRARLLAEHRPEPVVGLLACFVVTKDYYQASSLIGPLVRQWPGVLTRQDLLTPFGTPEELRLRLTAIQQIRGPRDDRDLDLLIAFHSWFAETHQAAVSRAVRLGVAAGPESSAAALASAMQMVMMASGGG